MTGKDKAKYLDEVCRVLRREGFYVERPPDDRPMVKMDGEPLCELKDSCGILYRMDWVETEKRSAAKERVCDLSKTVAEYVREFVRAPLLEAYGLEHQFRQLADFNGIVLAAQETKYGLQFVTWSWDTDHAGVSNGHYFGEDYIGAKRDFAIRCGLVPKEMIFTEDQLVEIYRCCTDTMDHGYELTEKQEREIESVREQIEEALPDLDDRIREQNAANEETMYDQNM